jgi:serine O-acetyltransferase
VTHRLSSCSGGNATICPIILQQVFSCGFESDELEFGHTMSAAVREDALCVWRRDPACETLLEVVLFMKGFLSLVVHRAARRAWKPISSGDDGNGSGRHKTVKGEEYKSEIKGTRFVALLLQSQASSAFGVDIHPAAQIGAGVMIDHATGVVIGETATVGDGTTILHDVTLGGTGKESGDRHPKIGKDVLIGAGTQILGNISVGDRAKIGAGSVVLRPIPTGATAVGSPARIIGFTPKGERPGSSVDISLEGVEPLMGTSTAKVEKPKTIMNASPKSNPLPVSSEVMSKTIREMESEGDTEELTSADESGQLGLGIEDDDDNDNTTSDSDDDNVTDFGTPAKLHYVKSSHDDNMCPFRNTFCQTSTSKDMISHKKLRSLLLQEGCSDGETVEVFFELLHLVPEDSNARQCGCIPLNIFAKYFPEIGVEKTRLDKETCLALAKGDLKTLGMSKKACKSFRSMFKRLGKIPSSSSLTSLACQRRTLDEEKGERQYSLLDTTGFVEEIAI